MLVSGLVGGLGLGGGKVVAFMVAPMTGLPALRVANQEWSARGRISATSTDSSSSQRYSKCSSCQSDVGASLSGWLGYLMILEKQKTKLKPCGTLQ